MSLWDRPLRRWGRLSHSRPCAVLTDTGQGLPRQTGSHAAGTRARWAHAGPAGQGRAHGTAQAARPQPEPLLAVPCAGHRPALQSASWALTQPHANHRRRRICDPALPVRKPRHGVAPPLQRPRGALTWPHAVNALSCGAPAKMAPRMGLHDGRRQRRRRPRSGPAPDRSPTARPGERSQTCTLHVRERRRRDRRRARSPAKARGPRSLPSQGSGARGPSGGPPRADPKCGLAGQAGQGPRG